MLSLTGAKKGSSPAVRPKTSMIPAAKISNSKNTVGSKSNYLQPINVKVLEIESMITTKLIREKTKTIKDRKKAQKEDRNEQEKDLEKGKDPGKKNIKIPKVPKLGMFGWLKRFIGSVILAFFANKMLNHLPKLVGLVKGIQGVLEFVSDIGITLINALATFVDWGYKAYDATRGFLKTIGGNGLAENFDKVLGLVDTALFLTTVLAGSMAVDAMTGGDGGGFDPLDFFRRKGAQKAAGKVAAKGGAKVAAKGTAAAAGTAAAIVAGVGLLSSALGEGAFQLRKIGKGIESGAKERYEEKSPLDPRKQLDFLLYQGSRFINHNLNGLGVILDIIGAPFRYAIELINFGIMAMFGDKEGMKRQRKNLAKFDARVREGIRQMLNVATFGFGFKGKGSFGNMFGDEAATKEMASKMQEGGVAGNRNKVKRRLKKRRGTFNINRLKKPVFRPLPTAPRGDVKNKDGQPNRAWWDFLGWAGSSDGNLDISESGSKLGKRVSEVGNTLGKNDYFGPILSLASKVILNKKIEKQDYDNIGLGINRLLNEGILKKQISEGIPGYAEGGKVASALAAGIDASGWVSDTFKKELSSEIRKKYEKIGVTGSSSESSPGSSSDSSGSGRRSSRSMSGSSTGGIQGSGINKGIAIAKKLMVDMNISAAAASGIVGNLMLESGLIPDNVENGKGFEDGPVDNIPVGTRRVGYGYGQWTNSRLEEFRKFLTQRGVNDQSATDDDNYAYLLKELNGDEPLFNHWKTKTSIPEDDPAKAATWFMMNWERPGVPHQDKRQEYARAVFEKLEGVTKKIAQAEIEAAGGSFIPAGRAGGNEGEVDFMDPDNLAGLDAGKPKKVYMHWTAGGYNSIVGPYHTIFTGDGTMHRRVPYGERSGHTYNRNTNSVGLSVAAMAGAAGNYQWPKQAQLEGMTNEIARLSNEWGWKASDINIKNVMTHGEAGSNKDGRVMHDNYGPTVWGGTAERWDLDQLNASQQIGQGGEILRGMIAKKLSSGEFMNDDDAKRSHAGTKLSNREQMLKILPGQSLLDENTSKALGATNLARFNAASTPEEMRKISGQIAGVSDYAPYEQGAQQTIVVNNNNQEQPMDDYGTQDQGLSAMMGNSYDNSFEFLDYQG